MDTESDMESNVDHRSFRSLYEEPPNLLIHFFPIVSSVNPASTSDTKTTSEPEPSSLTDHGNTQKAEESTLQETGTESFFEIAIPRSDFCSKESDTSGSHSDSFDIITIEIIHTPFWRDSYRFVIAGRIVPDFKNVISNFQSTVILIKNWSKVGSIKVKLAPHSSSTSFLNLGVLSHPSVRRQNSLYFNIRSLMLRQTAVQQTRSLEFFYSEAARDEQKLFTLPLAIYSFPFDVKLVENYSVAARSQSTCVAIEVELNSEKEFRLMVKMITPEMKIIISKLTLDEGLGNLEKLKSLPQFTIKVAHLDAGRYSLDAAVLDAFLDIFPSVDEISCQAMIIKDEEQLSKLVAVINREKECKVRLSILKLDLRAFTDLEATTFDRSHNSNLQVDELRLKLIYTDITSLTSLLTKLHNFTILELSIKMFLTNSRVLPLPVFSIQRVIPLSKYKHLKEIEISNFANPILMDDLLPPAACKEIKLRNVVLEFSSLETLQQFSHLKSNLLLERFSVRVDGEEGNNKLILMMSMTSKEQNVKRIAYQIDKHIASESLYYSYMKKKVGDIDYPTETKVALKGDITAFSCESLIQFCCEWNFDLFIELDCIELELKCLTPHCTKCSALTVLFLLIKYHDRPADRFTLSDEFTESSKKILAIQITLSISNVSWLLEQLSEHLPGSKKAARKDAIPFACIPKLEIFIKPNEPRSSITEILIPSLICLRRFGIEIKELKLLVDQDDSGWSFIRLCSTEFKVKVKFKNSINVKLPPHATKSMITIECFAIPQKTTTLEGEASFPIIFVDQLDSPSFAESISVQCPIVLGRGNPKRFTIKGPKIIYPTDISEYGKLTYTTDKILPPNFAETWRHALNLSEHYFDNCAYICVHPDETNSELIHFECLRAFGQKKLGQSKFLPFCEIKKLDLVTDEKVSIEIRGNIRFFGNSDFSQLEFWNPSPQKKVQTIKMKLIDSSMEPKCTIACRVDSSNSESGSFDFQWSGIELIDSIPELQALFTSDAQTRKLPLSLLAIDLEQLNATELEISENNLQCKVDLLDVSIAKTSCDAINVLTGKVQNLSRIKLSVVEVVEADEKTSIVPFNNLLKSSLLSLNLTYVKLSCPSNVLHIEDLFQILIDSSNRHNISELHFSRVQLAWSARSKIKQFCENFETYSAIRSDFVFFIDSCEAIIDQFDTNVNLILLMSLTVGLKWLADSLKLIESTNFQLNDQQGRRHIEKLRLEFKQSVFSTIDIAGVIFAPAFEDMSMLCKLWRVKSETIHCQNLLFEFLENETESDLFSLLFALSNVNAVGGDELDRLFSKTSFSMTSLSYLHKFLISADILTNPRKNEVVATSLKVEIQCHESRCEFFRLQTETLSTLKQMGISFKSVLVSVETDDTNWAYVKIALTAEKHRIQFSNEVTVTFPANCTKEPRTVSIEVHPIPDEVIKRVCAWHGTDATCHVSPVVFIDQKDNTPFLEDVCVQVPYSSSNPNVCGERLFAEAFTKRCYEQEWSLVAKKNVKRSWYTLTYNSKHFSPFSTIASALQKVFTLSDFADAYFPNCVYVTVETLDHKPRNVKFDCIKVQNEQEWKDLKLLPEMEIRKIRIMERDDKLLAELAPNLRIDEYFFPEEANEKLRFFHPEVDQNEQEYVMKKVNLEQEPQGRVIYYRDRAGIETRLRRDIVYLVPKLEGANLNPVLNVMRPEDPDMHRGGDPEENLERPLEANPPVPANAPHLDDPEVDQVENNAQPTLDPERNWVIGPPLNPDGAMGPEINPRELVGPGMDADGFVRPDEVSDLKEVSNISFFCPCLMCERKTISITEAFSNLRKKKHFFHKIYRFIHRIQLPNKIQQPSQ